MSDEFSTAGELSIVVPRSELRSVREQVENELADVELDLSASSMSAQSARSDGGSGRQSRRTLRLDQDRNEFLDDIALYLEDIEDHVAEGGMGAGGGLAAELLGVGGETAGDAVIEGASTTVDGISTAVGTAVGNAVGGLVGGTGGGGDGGGGGDILSPTIDTNTTLSPTFSPAFQPTFNPEFSPDFSTDLSPELDVAPEVSVSPNLSVSPQVAVSPDIDFPDLNFGSDIQSPHPVEITNWPDVSGVAKQRGPQPRSGKELLGDAASRGTGGAVAGGVIGTISPDPFTTAGGAIVGGATGVGSVLVGEVGRRLGGGGGGGNRSQSPTEITATVTHSPTYNLEIDPRRFDQLATQIVDKVEKRVDRDIDQLRDDVEDLEDELGDLERDIARSGR